MAIRGHGHAVVALSDFAPCKNGRIARSLGRRLWYFAMSCSPYDRLLEIVHGSAAFELLRAGLSLGIFELIESGTSAPQALAAHLSIPPVRLQILSEGLIGLGLLEVDSGGFRNCAAIAGIIARGESPVLKTLVRFQAEIVSLGQRNFTESLLLDRNEGLVEFPGRGDTLYARLESDPKLQRVFFDYMQAYSHYMGKALIEAHDFSVYRRILDVGGGGGALAMLVAGAAPASEITLLDIDFARPIFNEYPAAGRARFHQADMHLDPFPGGYDLVLFAHQLVIWSPEQNLALLRKAYDALVPGGTVLICSSITDNDRRGPLMALLDAVYFQSVAAGFGQIYAFDDYQRWLSEAGFAKPRELRLPTWTPHGLIWARRPDK